ncbi:MAG: 50S ribosomal protein L15, partial [Gemmatimonadales bacterium]
VRPDFEGGQMPLIRRIPKRGFTNPFRVPAQPVNLKDLAKLDGDQVNPETLAAASLIGSAAKPVKILGTGEPQRAYVVSGCKISAAARQRIEQAGGKVED